MAQSLAQELLAGIPDSEKNSELRKLNQYNKPLHDLVIGIMTQIRRDTKSRADGQAMAQRQQGGGQAA